MEKTQQERIDSFIKEYGELVEKHQVDFVAYPLYVPDGQGGFRTIVQNAPVDKTERPVESPFVPER